MTRTLLMLLALATPALAADISWTFQQIDAQPTDANGFVSLDMRTGGTWPTVMELEHESDGVLNIAALVVLPAHFRRGLGRRLVEEALTRSGGRRITVSTGAKNTPSIALYEAAGFCNCREWTTGDHIPMVTLEYCSDQQVDHP